MAKKFSSEREDLYVMGYISRPVLQVNPKGENQKVLWLSFSDALLRYGSGLAELDLGDAYRKAGIALRGQLEQNFVVLHDKVEAKTFEKKKTTERRTGESSE